MGWAERKNREGGLSEQGAAALAQAITECTYSTQGCKRMPVRVICEVTGQGDAGEVEADMVLLCCDHAPLYQPKGEVVFDKPISDDALNFFSQHGI